MQSKNFDRKIAFKIVLEMKIPLQKKIKIVSFIFNQKYKDSLLVDISPH